MRISRYVMLMLWLAGLINIIFAGDAEKMVKNIDIPYTKYVLDNGLTLIVHEDHKAPIVAVNVWYHVGSKNEKPGKTGFAHLFEHLMFNGSENYNDEYFNPFELAGATDMNGTTNSDRTNYFENVPVSALDMALWMESDRMGHLIGAIDTAKLNEQRGVVQNEKRQGENQPYGKVWELFAKNCYPAGHPYSWTTIGSMEDLNAASLEDVHHWFKTYYGAANAVLVIAGDVKAEEVKKKVQLYFGDIPSGPPVDHYEAWIAKRSGTARQIVQDRVPQPRIYMVWNIPPYGTPCADYLDLASDILANSKNSRLYKKLVYEKQIATDVAAFAWTREIAGQFFIQVTAKKDQNLEEIKKIINSELDRFLKEGPTSEEIERVQNNYISNFVKGMERIGGFGGKSDILASNMVYMESPEYYKTILKRIATATPEQVHKTARKWLSDGVYILEVEPFPQYTTAEKGADRSKLPEVGTPPEAKFPKIQEARLDNGMRILLTERHTVPVVRFNMMFDAGYASDQFAKPGTADFAMSMLDEGTKKRDALEISAELESLGASLRAGSSLDVSRVQLTAMKGNLDKALDIYADVILNPTFPEKEFKRLQKQLIAGIQREKNTPIQMALRVFPKFLYGKGHAYGNPFTGSGTIDAIQNMTRKDLQKFHSTWIRPNNATLIVVGDITMGEVKTRMASLFKKWDKGEIPQKNISKVKLSEKPVVYVMDRPGAAQSVILAGHVAPPKNDPNDLAIDAMNQILGGSFTSRINMNLREDKHWSYGARTIMVDARGQRPYLVYAPVQTDKTKESMAEIIKELEGIIQTKPATQEELDKVKKNKTLKLAGIWETSAAVMGSVDELVEFNIPLNYYDTYVNNIRNLNLNQIQTAANKTLHPNAIVWLVVGDKDKIIPAIKQLGIEKVQLIDTDGNPVSQ